MRIWRKLPLGIRLRLASIRPWEVVGVALALVVLTGLILVVTLGPPRRSNWGFGPEWDCVNPGKVSGLTCIKHSP